MPVLDLEWDPNNGDAPLVLGWRGAAFPFNEVPSEVFADLRDSDIPKIVFTKADHRYLLERGFVVEGDIIDVQTMAWCYDETTDLSLDACVKRYLDVDPDKRISRDKGQVMFRNDDGTIVPIGEADMKSLLKYNERDLYYTRKLFDELMNRLDQTGMLDYWYKMQRPLSKVLLDMELNGLPINVEKTDAFQAEIAALHEHLGATLKEQGGLPEEFNLNSRDQLANFLYKRAFLFPTRIKLSKEDMAQVKEGEWPKSIPTTFAIEKIGRDYVHGEYDLKGLGLKPKVKAPKCAAKECNHKPGECLPSVSSKTLKVHYDHPWVDTLIDYRMYDKALQFVSVWLDVEKDGRLHTHFKQTGTATGRLSSSDPVNLQNIPSRGELGPRIRHLFEAPEGKVFVNGDFSQIEPRLMAHFSGDVEMRRVFYNGLDLYEEATVGVLGERYPKGTPERQLIRTCFLAMGYGAQPPKIRSNLAEEGFKFPLKKVETAYNDLIALYQGFWDWKEGVVLQAKEDRYVETIAGHRRHLDFRGGNGWKAERQAVNSIIQGSAADITAKTMVMAAKTLPSWKMILQVHDEIMFEVDKDMLHHADVQLFQSIAEEGHGFKLSVPIVFKPQIAASWGDAK